MREISLANSVVRRKGRTARNWSLLNEADDLRVSARKDHISINFTVGSKGGGDLELQIEVGRKDFANVMRALLNADIRTTMAALHRAITMNARHVDAQ
jgi:hypothetical protein